MTVNEAYYIIQGMAHIRGLDEFYALMPKHEFTTIWNRINNKHRLDDIGRDSKIIHSILRIVVKRHKSKYICCNGCKYRMPYLTNGLPKQKNALRVEIISTFSDRCGWDLIEGRTGGVADDYHRCTYVDKKNKYDVVGTPDRVL